MAEMQCLFSWEFGQLILTPIGVKAISRWLSAATPPGDEDRQRSTPEGVVAAATPTGVEARRR